MIKRWNKFIREFVESENYIDAKMQELRDLVDNATDGNNIIYEWENKNDHELTVSFSTTDLSITYDFDIDDLHVTKTAGGTIDFQTSVESIDEGLELIEKDIQSILGISESKIPKKINNPKAMKKDIFKGEKQYRKDWEDTIGYKKEISNMKHLKTFESYEFEDFTHSDMEDVKDLLEEGLTVEEIADELNFDVNKVEQIISSLKKSQQIFDEDDMEDIATDSSKKFEAFLIPKPVRKFHPWWKDEDIALEILKELKSLKGNSEGIAKLLISENRGYSFIVDGFKFHVKYGFRMGTGGTGVYSGSMKMNDKDMGVSTEVCKQIYNLVEQLKNTDLIEQEEDDKKDFRINRGLM